MGWQLALGSFGAPSMKDVGWGRWLFVMGFVALLCAAYSMPLPSARMHLGDCSCAVMECLSDAMAGIGRESFMCACVACLNCACYRLVLNDY